MVQKQIQAVVFCGPSGSGKSTLLKMLFQEFPDKFGFSVSHTTRLPRPDEVDGVNYHFTNREDMESAIQRGEFLESAVYSNNRYGTSKKAVEEVLKSGKMCVLDIDVQGVKQVKQTDINALYIFVMPPSMESLERRLKSRGTETEETLANRLKAAKEEIEYGKIPNNFDLIVVNDNLSKAYESLKDFLIKELAKCIGGEGNIQS